MKYLKVLVVYSAFCMLCIANANASDLMREKRMADEIVDSIIDGEPIYLNVNGHQFLNIFIDVEKPKGTVIVLHGRGFHPDWQDTVNPLRVGLAEAGWNTLSVQMPVLQKDAKYYDYVPLFSESFPRIDAAIQYARESNNGKVIIVAHSCSVHMVMAWVDSQTKDISHKIDAFVGLGMGATDYQQFMKNPYPYKKLTVPVLDVYGENDHPAIVRMASSRLHRISLVGNKRNLQKMLANSNHYYIDKGEELTEIVSHWLNAL